MAWNIPCSSQGRMALLVAHLKVGVQGFLIKTQGRANTFWGKKYQNSPALPQEKKLPTLNNVKKTHEILIELKCYSLPLRKAKAKRKPCGSNQCLKNVKCRLFRPVQVISPARDCTLVASQLTHQPNSDRFFFN